MGMDGCNFIDGWVGAESKLTFQRENPAAASTIVATFPESDRRDVDAAVRAVTSSRSGWGAMSLHERKPILDKAAALLVERAESIGRALVAEEGKTLAEAVGEVHRAAEVFTYFASFATSQQGQVFGSARRGVRLETRHRPLGIVAAITPFNFPAFVSSFKIAGALMAGNAVVWKPSPLTPMTGAHLVTALLDAGLPPNAIAYLNGGSAELGEALVEHPEIAAVSFTGSTQVGHLVELAAVRHGKRFQVEKGGSNPLIVTEDADLDAAADAIIDGAFGGSGQKCTATSRLIVSRRIADALVDAVCDRARSLVIGRGDEAQTFMGPLVSAPARAAFEQAVDRAEAEGATIVRGGQPSVDLAQGHFVQPSVIREAGPGAAIFRDEVFGPTVAVVAYDSLEEAFSLANATSFGLSAGIYTRSLATAAAFGDQVVAGVLNVNLPTTGLEPQVPFGGLKSSGSGPKELGPTALTFFSTETVIATHP